MDTFAEQLIYVCNDNMVIDSLSNLRDEDKIKILRMNEKKFTKHGYIKPYSLTCKQEEDYPEFMFNQFTSKLKKRYVCSGKVHYPKKGDIYKVMVDIIQYNCGIKCSVNDISKKNERTTVLSLIVPITNINIDNYKVNDIVYVKVIDVKYENNSNELFAIGDIISENEIHYIQNMKPIINNIMKNYVDNTYIIKPELVNRIIIKNNHLNIIYPVKYCNNKLVYSIYEFLTNINDEIDEDEYTELYVKYVYIKYDINITDEILDINNKMETFDDIIEAYDETNSEKYCDYSSEDITDEDEDNYNNYEDESEYIENNEENDEEDDEENEKDEDEEEQNSDIEEEFSGDLLTIDIAKKIIEI